MSFYQPSSNDILIVRRKGTPSDPFVPLELTMKVSASGYVVLPEIPDTFAKVQIKTTSNVSLTETQSKTPTIEQFYCDYQTAHVYFHPNDTGKDYVFNFMGTGASYISDKRIAVEENNGNITKTLNDLVVGVNETIDTLNQVDAVQFKNRQDSFDVQLAQKVSQEQLNAVASGAPKGVYATLSDLQTAFPTGNTNVYLVTADGKWYYWNDSAWTAGGTYQGTGLSDGTVSYPKLDQKVKESIKNGTVIDSIVSSDIKNQSGQTVSFTYSNENLVITTASSADGCLPVFDAKNYNKFEFTVGNARTGGSFIPVFAVQKNATYNSQPVTKYLTFRSTGGNLIVKDTYFNNTTGGQVYNVDVATVANTSGQDFTADSVVKIVNENRVIKLFINGVFVTQFDISASYLNHEFHGGVFLAGYTGGANKVLSKVNLSFDNILDIKKNISSLQEQIDGIETPQAPKRITKIGHISFDDVIACFQDINTNASTYTSIFQNAFLGELKRLHDLYGATFSCYVFYKETPSSTFNLSNCTNKFASEFTANAGWLKFGFHGLDGSTLYDVTTATKATADYNTIITELLRITGSLDCIDRMPRISSFKGNLESMVAFRDSKCGIVGALTSMDGRDSYYLDPAQNSYINSHDKMYDPATYLTFVNTTTISNVGAAINTLDNANGRNIVETFLHESQMPSVGLENACSWLKDNGYTFDFPMYLVLP